MDVCYIPTPRLFRTIFAGAMLALSCCFLPLSSVWGQNFERVGNQYIAADVAIDPFNGGGGRFILLSPMDRPETKFLYGGFLTTNYVFRVKVGNDIHYYTNAKNTSYEQPISDETGQPITYQPFDSIYISPSVGNFHDTIAIVYKNLNGYTVTVRFFAEGTKTAYDDGTDLIIEFSYDVVPFMPPSELGIFLMLDTFNSNAEGMSGGAGDMSSILTNRGYFPVGSPGKRFASPYDSIPDFYHVGNFLFDDAIKLNDILPVHRLTGYSHGGLPLTTPEMFAVGAWQSLRGRSWEVGGSDVARAFSDCATAMRWGGLFRKGTVRTAFGRTDRAGNNIFHCRDKNIFVDIKTERVIEQKEKNGVYTPSQFDVEMWVTNTGIKLNTVAVTLTEPIGAPDHIGRLTIDPSTPATQERQLMQKATQKYRWRVNLEPGTNDSLIQIPLNFEYRYTNMGDDTVRGFGDPCQPLVAIKGWRDKVPPPVDTVPPVISRESVALKPKPTWTFMTYDRHPGYLHDTGLDTIKVEQNENNNFELIAVPQNFVRCDTTINVGLTARVIDTTKRARIIFAVYDCRGNVSHDSATYDPRPDIFKPEIDSIMTRGSAGPPCNARTYEYLLIDSLHQQPDAGDAGFGALEVVQLANFDAVEINHDNAFRPIQPFDVRASFRLHVTDSMFDASATLRMVDFAGNDDTIRINYCTLPDTLPPVATATPIPGSNPDDPIMDWNVHASDIRAWDRGLESVVVLSNTNMKLAAPVITPGDDSVNFMVSVVDSSLDGEIVLQVRDMFYAGNPLEHADTVTVLFSKIPDTLAPNIIYRSVTGTNGKVIDVEVNDIHYFGTELYKYDRGLKSVQVAVISPNMRLVTPIQFSQGDMVMHFRVEVVDTLSLNLLDSICVDAVDRFDNRSSSCHYYPLRPDIRSPLFSGAMDANRMTIAGIVSDRRNYDRGLGMVTLENASNVVLVGGGQSLDGVPSAGVLMNVGDPTREVAGTLVIRDHIGIVENSAESDEIHAVRLPFLLPSVRLRVVLPEVVEPNVPFKASIIAADAFPGKEVRKIAFDLTHSIRGAHTGTRNAMAAISVVPNGAKLSVTCVPTLSERYMAGDTLGSILFTATGSNSVETFTMMVDPSSLVINDGAGSDIVVTKPGDSERSMLHLPVPYAAIGGDSITYINGECERILTTIRGAHSKAAGFAILGVMPQPSRLITGGENRCRYSRSSR